MPTMRRPRLAKRWKRTPPTHLCLVQPPAETRSTGEEISRCSPLRKSASPIPTPMMGSWRLRRGPPRSPSPRNPRVRARSPTSLQARTAVRPAMMIRSRSRRSTARLPRWMIPPRTPRRRTRAWKPQRDLLPFPARHLISALWRVHGGEATCEADLGLDVNARDGRRPVELSVAAVFPVSSAAPDPVSASQRRAPARVAQVESGRSARRARRAGWRSRCRFPARTRRPRRRRTSSMYAFPQPFHLTDL